MSACEAPQAGTSNVTDDGILSNSCTFYVLYFLWFLRFAELISFANIASHLKYEGLPAKSFCAETRSVYTVWHVLTDFEAFGICTAGVS